MKAGLFSSASLSRRFAVAAAVLTAAAVLLVTLVSFWMIERERAHAAELLQQREAAFHAATVTSNLQALATRMAEVANSPILATALVDSSGKETYLAPFLHGLRQINGIPLQVLFTDFQGVAIAGNGAGVFNDADLAWLRRQLESGVEHAAILPGAQGDELVGVNLLRYSRTRTPEGALLYKIRLADLKPVAGAQVVAAAAAPGAPGRRSVAVALPAAYTPLALSLSLREDAGTAGAPLPGATPLYLLVGAAAAGLALLVFLLASRLALGLTEDLRRLEAFSGSLGDEGISQQRAALVGSSEVRSLARSINRMLDRLYRQHARLEAERQNFLALANTIPQLVWIAEPDGTISWYNDRWHAYAGTTPEQATADSWKLLHDPQVLPQVEERWRQARASGTIAQMTFPLRGADGIFRSFFTSVAPLRDAGGDIVQWFGTSTDVSPLEEAEQAVHQSEERLQQGLVAARMAVWEWEPQSGSLSFAANLHSVFGTWWEDIDGLWERIEPDDLPALRAAIDQALRERGQYQALPRIRRADNGQLAWADMRGKVGLAADGRTVVVHAIAIDVTERKRAEEALRTADRHKDEFLAMLGHELRNPLAPISSAADMLKLLFSNDARVRQTAEIIARQVAHMRHLLDDLLDVSRVTRGLVTVGRERLDLARVVREAVEQAGPLVQSRRHQLSLALPEVAVTVEGDHTRLVQVATNLLNNAAKYTPPGGEIDVELALGHTHARLSVRDTGVGIGPELLPAVFDLFTQGSRTLDRTQGGLGLGLALVRKLVELHGGTVEAASAGAGQGSTFTVRLPLAS
jgi:PAS domain S-box-containing protein